MENERHPRIWARLSISPRDDKHRYQWCSFYDVCLREAAQKFWPSFSCYYCKHNPLHKREEKGGDYGKRT